MQGFPFSGTRCRYGNVDCMHTCVQDPTATLTNPIKPSCKQPDVAFKGSMVYWYNSTSWRDDMAWAASWMYRASGDPNYLSDAYGFYRTHKDLEGQLDIRYLVRSSVLF